MKHFSYFVGRHHGIGRLSFRDQHGGPLHRHNNLFVNVKVKDAIADRMRRETSRRPDSGPELDRTVIHLFWKEETPKFLLIRRGNIGQTWLPEIPGKAPMLRRWLLPRYWQRSGTAGLLCNPMCGSSTIAIEAALLATRRVPGLLRMNYAFMHLKITISKFTFRASQIGRPNPDVPGLRIIATDISEDAIAIPG